MLINIATGEEITKIPHKTDFRRWRRKLSDDAYELIRKELNRHIDEEGRGEIVTSSWVPGSDWTGTVYQPIYEACGEDPEAAALFFGLILWVVMMERPEAYGFGRYELNQIPIRGLTYFRVDWHRPDPIAHLRDRWKGR
jgi:hypothetical protein